VWTHTATITLILAPKHSLSVYLTVGRHDVRGRHDVSNYVKVERVTVTVAPCQHSDSMMVTKLETVKRVGIVTTLLVAAAISDRHSHLPEKVL
jgi:hypothetical protein